MTTATVKHHRMLIGGEDIDSPQRMTIIDPSDESVVATVARGDASHIDAVPDAGARLASHPEGAVAAAPRSL